MELEKKTEMITTYMELSSFIIKLTEDLSEHPETWSNTSLENFLEALSAWLEDMDGYYASNNKPVPNQPGWNTLAEMLLAAKYYE